MLVPLALLIGLAAADAHNEALVHLGDVSAAPSQHPSGPIQ